MQRFPVLPLQVLALSSWLSSTIAVWGWMDDVVFKRKPELTCWTCPSKPDNDACNAWAPDVPCPANTSVCRTEHGMDVKTGRTLRVIKSCAVFSDCDETHIGCHGTTDGMQRVCVHCCDHAYCNEGVAVNYSHASSLSSLTSAIAHAPAPCPTPHLLVVAVVSVLIAPLLVL